MTTVSDAKEAAVAAERTARALDVTVLMGGPSAEREVSLMSGSSPMRCCAAGTTSPGRISAPTTTPRSTAKAWT